MAGWLADLNASLSSVEGRVFVEDDDSSSNSGSEAEAMPFDFGDVFRFVRSTGQKILDSANSRLFQGPVADCLAPSPFPQPDRKLSPRAIVGVIGSDKHEYAHMCEPLGQWVAQQGHHLLTFMDHGVAHAVSRAFALARMRPGCSLGIEPVLGSNAERAFGEYVDIPLRVPVDTLQCSSGAPRTIFAHTAHVIVVLPGAPEHHLGECLDTPMVFWQDGDDGHLPRGLRRVKHFSEVMRFIAHALRRSDVTAALAAAAEADKEEAAEMDEFEMLDPGDT